VSFKKTMAHQIKTKIKERVTPTPSNCYFGGAREA
jgi:hypothetical protein